MASERSAEDIQREIEQSRAALATTVDQLAYRTDPKRLVGNAKTRLREEAQTPAGRAVLAAAGALVVLLVVKRVRKGTREAD